MLHPQPLEPTITEERHPVEGRCEHCGTEELATYKVAHYRGWVQAVKCQRCLTLASADPITAPPQAAP